MALRVVCLLSVVLAANTVYGLTCYKCDSSETALCNYGLTRFTYDTADCSKEHGGGLVDSLTSWVPKSCVKITAKSKDGSEYVARGCMPAVGDTACTTVVSTFNFFQGIDGGPQEIKCYTCEGEKCNSAHKYTGLGFVGFVLAAIAFMF